MDFRSIHAVVRFGLGQRGAEPLPLDPESWLTAQLEALDTPSSDGAPDSSDAFTAIQLQVMGIDQFKKGMGPEHPSFIADRFQADRIWTMQNMIGSSQPFRERLVIFWANHFTVSARAGGEVLALLGPYIQEAIRPHITGHFVDMLRAVMHHPAMLYYLNNADSAGPNSQTGRANGKGLNENLARECLELHTLGVDSGYTQQDVTSFAKILTGWSAEYRKQPVGFVFRPEAHEPGLKTVMGETFPEGYEGGEAALDWLGHHQATYTRIATQLVHHFVADMPDQSDITHIASVLRDTGGDLKAASHSLTKLSNAWHPLVKFRTPVDYILAVYRALDFTPISTDDKAKAYWATQYLGQPFQAAPLPNGWTDTAKDWMDGESLVRRADWVFSMAGRPNAPDPALFLTAYEPLLSVHTKESVRGAGSRREALALLLASPEFMRR